MANAGTITVELELNDGQFVARSRRAGQVINELNGRFGALSVGMGSAERGILKTIASMRDIAIVGHTVADAMHGIKIMLVDWSASIIKSNADLEKMGVLLEGLSKASTKEGRLKEAANDMDFLIKRSQNAPFKINELSNSFTKLKGTGMKDVDRKIISITDAIAKFGGNDESLHRATVAIQQMASKGVVSMEELRQQLGEAVPDAMKMMADGMGITMSHLVEEVSKGKVKAIPAIEAMMGEIERTMSGSAENMMQTWTGMASRFDTQWTLLSKTMGDAGMFSEAKSALGELIQYMQSGSAAEFAASFGKSVGGLTRNIVDGIKGLRSFSEEIKTSAQAILGWVVAVRGMAIAGAVIGGVEAAMLRMAAASTAAATVNTTAAASTLGLVTAFTRVQEAIAATATITTITAIPGLGGLFGAVDRVTRAATLSERALMLLRGALAIFTTPLGLVTTLVAAGGAAWFAYGDKLKSVESKADDAREAIANLTNEAGDLQIFTEKSFKEQIDRLHALGQEIEQIKLQKAQLENGDKSISAAWGRFKDAVGIQSKDSQVEELNARAQTASKFLIDQLTKTEKSASEIIDKEISERVDKYKQEYEKRSADYSKIYEQQKDIARKELEDYEKNGKTRDEAEKTFADNEIRYATELYNQKILLAEGMVAAQQAAQEKLLSNADNAESIKQYEDAISAKMGAQEELNKATSVYVALNKQVANFKGDPEALKKLQEQAKNAKEKVTSLEEGMKSFISKVEELKEKDFISAKVIPQFESLKGEIKALQNEISHLNGMKVEVNQGKKLELMGGNNGESMSEYAKGEAKDIENSIKRLIKAHGELKNIKAEAAVIAESIKVDENDFTVSYEGVQTSEMKSFMDKMIKGEVKPQEGIDRGAFLRSIAQMESANKRMGFHNGKNPSTAWGMYGLTAATMQDAGAPMLAPSKFKDGKLVDGTGPNYAAITPDVEDKLARGWADKILKRSKGNLNLALQKWHDGIGSNEGNWAPKNETQNQRSERLEYAPKAKKLYDKFSNRGIAGRLADARASLDSSSGDSSLTSKAKVEIQSGKYGIESAVEEQKALLGLRKENEKAQRDIEKLSRKNSQKEEDKFQRQDYDEMRKAAIDEMQTKTGSLQLSREASSEIEKQISLAKKLDDEGEKKFELNKRLKAEAEEKAKADRQSEIDFKNASDLRKWMLDQESGMKKAIDKEEARMSQDGIERARMEVDSKIADMERLARATGIANGLMADGMKRKDGTIQQGDSPELTSYVDKAKTMATPYIQKEVEIRGEKDYLDKVAQLYEQSWDLKISMGRDAHEVQLRQLDEATDREIAAMKRVTGEKWQQQELERLINERKLEQIKQIEMANEGSFERMMREPIKFGLVLQDAATSAVGGFADSMAEMAMSGKANFGEMTQTIIKDIGKMIIKTLILAAVQKLAGFMFGGGGGSMGAGSIVGSLNMSAAPFAEGGIMNPSGSNLMKRSDMEAGGVARSPKVAIFAEAGLPEAFIPLQDRKNVPIQLSRDENGNVVGASIPLPSGQNLSAKLVNETVSGNVKKFANGGVFGATASSGQQSVGQTGKGAEIGESLTILRSIESLLIAPSQFAKVNMQRPESIPAITSQQVIPQSVTTQLSGKSAEEQIWSTMGSKQAIQPRAFDQDRGTSGVARNGVNSSNVSLSINVTNNQSERQGEQNGDKKSENDMWNKFGDKVKVIVNKALVEEQRPGGLLYK